MPNETRNPNAQEAQRPQTRGFGSRSINICPNCSRPRESLVLVAVLVRVIGNGAVECEDEKEDDDDLVAAPLRSAVYRVAVLRFLRFLLCLLQKATKITKKNGIEPVNRSHPKAVFY